MMVEIVENLKIDDTDIDMKNISSLEVLRILPDGANINTKETELNDHEHINEVTLEEPRNPPSKWSSLTRAFQLGLAYDARPTNTSTKSAESSMQCEMKTVDKKGPLGKMFKHGLPKFQNRPTSGNQLKKSEIQVSQLPPETLQTTNKRVKWNLFKIGKSQPHVPQLQVNDENVELKDEEKSRTLSKILRLTSRHSKGDQDKMLGLVDGGSNSECLPSTETRGHSLGKFFRYSKNPPVMKDFVDLPDEP